LGKIGFIKVPIIVLAVDWIREKEGVMQENLEFVGV
jgi:hypothetical protein